MRDAYTRQGDGFLVVYDITNPESFQEAQQIYEFCCRVQGADSVPAVSNYKYILLMLT